MNKQNSCYTYFKIVGSFDPDKVTVLLELAPERTHKIGDMRSNGAKYDFALWEIGRCGEYDTEVANQMRKTISLLKDKLSLLERIRQENDIEYFLEIVPTVYAGETSPCLAPPLDVIDFCHATRTNIDIDLYVCDSDE